MKRTVEYRVRPVTRYQVTRHYSEEGPGPNCSGGCESKGEFDSKAQAIEAMHGFVHLERVPMNDYPPSLEDVDTPSVSWTDSLPDTPYPA